MQYFSKLSLLTYNFTQDLSQLLTEISVYNQLSISGSCIVTSLLNKVLRQQQSSYLLYGKNYGLNGLMQPAAVFNTILQKAEISVSH